MTAARAVHRRQRCDQQPGDPERCETDRQGRLMLSRADRRSRGTAASRPSADARRLGVSEVSRARRCRRSRGRTACSATRSARRTAHALHAASCSRAEPPVHRTGPSARGQRRMIVRSRGVHGCGCGLKRLGHVIRLDGFILRAVPGALRTGRHHRTPPTLGRRGAGGTWRRACAQRRRQAFRERVVIGR